MKAATYGMFLSAAAIVAGGLLSGAAAVAAPEEPNSDIKPVKAVMFIMEYDKDGYIRHAQVIGGYDNLDACEDAMPKVLAIVGPQIDPGLHPDLFCSGIKHTGPENKDTI